MCFSFRAYWTKPIGQGSRRENPLVVQDMDIDMASKKSPRNLRSIRQRLDDVVKEREQPLFANQSACQASAVHPQVFSAPAPPVIHDCASSPIAMNSPNGEYAEFTQQTPAQDDDIAFVGGNRFAQNVSSMSSASDKYYNYSLSSGEGASNSYSSVLAYHRGRRMMFPSKFMSSPFINERKKVSVTARDQDVYRVLLSISNSRYKMKEIIDYKNVKVTFGAPGSGLCPGGKINTFVVNALCKKIFDTVHARSNKKHYFFTKISDYLVGNYHNEETRLQLEAAALKCFNAATRAHYLPNTNMMFFPIYFEDNWSVIVVHIGVGSFVVLEPCVVKFGEDSEYHKRIRMHLELTSLLCGNALESLIWDSNPTNFSS